MKRIKRYFRLKKTIAFAAVFLTIALVSCEKYIIPGPEINPDVTLKFQSDILPIFAKNKCAACHPNVHAPDLSSANAYNSLISGGFISVSSPESSILYKQLVNNSSHQAKTTPEEELKILTWIQQGAKDN